MEFLHYIFGEHSISFYLAAVFFLLLGHLTNKIIVFNRRSLNVPFNFKYWLKDNWMDVVFALILSFVAIRFTDSIVGGINNFLHIDLSFVADNMFYYFAAGLGFQTLLHWVRKKLTFIKSSKHSDGSPRSIIRPKGTPLNSGKK